MQNYNSFDVIRVPFPFSDKDISKTRPAIVLSKDKGSELLVCCMVTSAKASSFELDFTVNDIPPTGLPKSSVVRVEKIFTIDKRLILNKEGQLSTLDSKMLKRKFFELFDGI